MKDELYPGLAVSLSVDGQKLTEYNDDENEDLDIGESSCFVEAASGANFSVDFESPSQLTDHPQDSVQVRVCMDGKFILAKVYTLYTAIPRTFKKSILGVESNTKSGTVLEKFTFTDLQTNDGPADANKKEFAELGQIKVDCTWVRSKNSRPAAITDGPSCSNAKSTAAIPEKCLKGRAISQQATLGKPEHRSGKLTFVDVDYPYGSAPFATFIFSYRSRRDLQIEGIIPRSPSPVPLEDRNEDDLSPEEMRELLRRLRAREAEHAQIKREKRERSITLDDDDDEGVEVLDTQSKRRRVSDDSGIDIVDLTED